MSVTLTYDPVLARVRIDATALGAANHATIESSTDQIMWTTIRGGVTAAVTAGAFTSVVDDYEFVSGVPNYYRVRGIETGAITYVAAGAAATGNNASVTPALPAGIVVGDLLVILASIRNSGTGTVNTPAGWTLMRAFGNMALLGRRYVSGDVAPLVTFTGGVANADTIAQMAAWRRADLPPVTGADLLNSSAQNIAHPALTVPAANMVLLMAGWKQDDWTSVATLAAPVGTAEIGETATTTGDDAGQVWDYLIQTTAANVAAAAFVVTGGASAISRSMVVALQHAPYLNEQTANLTPVLNSIWLKSVTRPFLNRAVTVVDWSDPDRPGRGSAHAAVGRSLPIAETDVRGSKQYSYEIYTPTSDDSKTLDFILASGDVLFVHTPAGCEVPGGHVLVDVSNERRPHKRASSRVFSLPVVQCAPPGPDVVGVVSTWQTVLNSYATWADVLAANATWADLLARIAPPSEVVVP